MAIMVQEPPFSLEANGVHIAGVHPLTDTYVVKLRACRLQFPLKFIRFLSGFCYPQRYPQFAAVYYTH